MICNYHIEGMGGFFIVLGVWLLLPWLVGGLLSLISLDRKIYRDYSSYENSVFFSPLKALLLKEGAVHFLNRKTGWALSRSGCRMYQQEGYIIIDYSWFSRVFLHRKRLFLPLNKIKLSSRKKSCLVPLSDGNEVQIFFTKKIRDIIH